MALRLLNPLGGVGMNLTTDSRKVFSASLSWAGDVSDESGWARPVWDHLEFQAVVHPDYQNRSRMELAHAAAQSSEPWKTRRPRLPMYSRCNVRHARTDGAVDDDSRRHRLTPRLSLQIFAQPLIASGDYSEFKELATPRTFDFNRYANPIFHEATRTYVVDPDGDGAVLLFAFAVPTST